jgi:hypothetical protein
MPNQSKIFLYETQIYFSYKEQKQWTVKFFRKVGTIVLLKKKSFIFKEKQKVEHANNG